MPGHLAIYNTYGPFANTACLERFDYFSLLFSAWLMGLAKMGGQVARGTKWPMFDYFGYALRAGAIAMLPATGQYDAGISGLYGHGEDKVSGTGHDDDCLSLSLHAMIKMIALDGAFHYYITYAQANTASFMTSLPHRGCR